jgi:DNA-binding NtrC family response regulator
MNKGKRITTEIVREKLQMEVISSNANLPIHVEMESDQVERELILKQLLYLRQDINEVKQILVNPSTSSSNQTAPSNPALFLPPPDSLASEHEDKENIEDAGIYALNEETVGEISLEELEHEMIERSLEKFKGNRRKTAQALNISERTLYRKIKEYEI